MGQNSYSVSAPGSLMLMGEHAVLYGKKALVMAIDRRLYVQLVPRNDQRVILSSALGEYAGDLIELKPSEPFRFVLEAIKHRCLEQGVELYIKSQLSSTTGLGSSAAVTVATLAAIDAWREGALRPANLAVQATEIIRKVQRSASGADAAASALGGLIKFQNEPTFIFEFIPALPEISAVYSGSKKPTPEVIRLVDQLYQAQPLIVSAIFEAMDISCGNCADALARKDRETVGKMMNINQGLMDALGLGSNDLYRIVSGLRECPGVMGAKISGAGLGDCAVGYGSSTACVEGYQKISVKITQKGVCLEEDLQQCL